MSTTDALLLDDQATTSLYERIDDPDERRVLPLRQAKAAYCALDGATREDPKAAHAQQSPEMVVQVRKRNGKTQLLIDGYVSTGEPEAGGNATRHELLSHTGLHEDVETRTRVFSPIAVVAAVEDGQHPFQRVAVAVVHNYASFGEVMEPSTVLSEAVVQEHHVTDVRCNVVRVPYPLAYPNPPTVIVYDNMQQTVTDQQQLEKLRLGRDYEAAGSFVTSMWDLYMQRNQSAAGAQLTAAGGISAATFLGGLVGTALYSLGATMPAFIIGSVLPLSKDIIRGLMTGEYQNLVTPLLNAASLGVRKYIDQSSVGLRETKFTLSELAMVIESLAMRRKPQNTKAPPPSINNPSAMRTRQHKQEALVWHWLSTAKKSDAPPLDTTHMDVTDAHVAQLHLRITVDDSLSCDSKAHVHKVYCGRGDAPMLAAAATGTFDDLVRLHAAIQALKRVLTEETEDGATLLHDLWIDSSWYNPMLYAATLANELKASSQGIEQAGGSLAESLNQMRLAGIRRRTKKAYLNTSWTEASVEQSGSIRTARKAVLRSVLAGIEEKLLAPLFSDPATGSKLYLRMQAALEDRQRVLVANPPAAWERRLPQRAVSSYGPFLFSAVRDTESAYADVDVGGAAARLYHEYHDASKSLSECMRNSRVALKRFVTEWEASSDTRIQLRCMCASIESATPRFVDAVSYATLALATPVDIRFAAALASPTEHSQRRIRVLVKRGAGAPSVLEALKLEHSDLSLLACQVFGDLWADELVALYRTSTHKQAEMLEMASVRAAVRLRAAGELLLQLVAPRRPGDDAGGFSDVALNGTDVALVATQPGRDAARLVGRVLFSQAYLAVRSALSNELRDAARAATRAATVFERAPPVALPHEACASLFGDRLDGLAAFLRAKDLSSDRVVLEAMVAAYPSARLLVLNADNQEASVQRARHTSSASAQARAKVATSSELVRAMRFRLASLRIDTPSLDAAVASPPQSITADQLATRLAATSMGSDDHFSFYVPFGFGDARPPPTLPPCAAPLFGTVPVHGPALVSAYRSIASALDQTPQASAKSTLAIRLEPEFDCIKLPPNDPSGEEAESIHPNVVQVLREGDDVVVRYTASRMPASRGNAPTSEKAQYAVTSLAEAAGMHVHSVAASQLALTVSCTAWNAERVVQAVVAALASGDDTAEYDAVDVTLVLPPTDTRVSQWYARPPNPMAIAQNELWQTREKEMWDAIEEGVLANQKARMASALKVARDLDTARTSILTGTPRREELIASIEGGRLNDDPVQDFEERKAAFTELFGVALLGELEAYLLSRFRSVLDAVPGETSDDGTGGSMTEEAMTPLLEAIVAVEKLDPLTKRNPSAPRGTALAPAVRDIGEQTAPLLAALGVGMAMLTPQLRPVDVRCVAVDSSQPLSTDLSHKANALADVFSRCATMRLSEACLVAGRNV